MQNEVDGLQKRIRIQDEQLRIKNEQLQQAETENQRLKLDNSELQKQVGNSIQPDYEATRDRTLTKLKMGRQSAAGKAIDAFIKELAKLPMPNTQFPDCREVTDV